MTLRPSGSNSPTWKGGHRYWKEGRWGRDKDGLSWKVQRRLAWERDGNCCRHCGAAPKNRRPDVHHVTPYRISFSHALEHLICLCQHCHKVEDAKIPVLWGGKTFGGTPRSKRKNPRCSRCDGRRKLTDGLCAFCRNDDLASVARTLRLAGLTYRAIGKQIGRSHPSVMVLLGAHQWKKIAAVVQSAEHHSGKVETLVQFQPVALALVAKRETHHLEGVTF